MDETYIKVKGQWTYLYRAVDKYGHTIDFVEQGHGAIKRLVRPMRGIKSFRSARTTLQGIELMHVINKGQMVSDAGENLSAAEQFFHWPPEMRPRDNWTTLQ